MTVVTTTMPTMTPPPPPAQPESNPFLLSGITCASELDYDHGFSRLFLSDTGMESSSKFRVEMTNFSHGLDDTVCTEPRRVLTQETALYDALRDGSVATGKAPLSSDPVEGSRVQASTIRDVRTTIITIPQEFSGGPLCITRSGLQDMIVQLNLPTTLLPVLYAFGSAPRLSEAGLDCFTFVRDFSHESSFSLTYLYRFKDRDFDRDGVPKEWKDRQIGVFHRHCALKHEDLYIILQPHPQSLFDGQLEYHVQTSSQARRLLLEDPFCVHQLLISTYFAGWRQYLSDVADDFTRRSAEAFAQDVKKDYSLEFEFLQRWRDIADSAAPVSTNLDSILRIVKGLREARSKYSHNKTLQSTQDFDIFAQTTCSQAEGLCRSARTLEKRIDNITDLLTNTIETRNQMVAVELNQHMERLTLDTLDDSTSVRTITYLSLIYLPGSFVATLFGMNLFAFNTSTQEITIAKNFWLYVVIFVPLTAITSGAAWTLSRKAKKKRIARDERYELLSFH